MYKFNPLEFGFEPISKFPELSYNYDISSDNCFIKIVTYAMHGGKYVYWYKVAIIERIDDRVQIYGGMHDYRKSNTYVDQGKSGNRVVYSGLVSTKKFAIDLLKHLLGTTSNDSVEKYGYHRLISCLGEDMRNEPDYL